MLLFKICFHHVCICKLLFGVWYMMLISNIYYCCCWNLMTLVLILYCTIFLCVVSCNYDLVLIGLKLLTCTSWLAFSTKLCALPDTKCTIAHCIDMFVLPAIALFRHSIFWTYILSNGTMPCLNCNLPVTEWFVLWYIFSCWQMVILQELV